MTALPRRPARRPIAAVGATGAALGVLAGLLELTIGPSIRSWLGDKHDTTRLGLATIVLALIALGAVLALARRPNAPAPRRFALAITVLVPALIGFTTVGRLWYLPGALLVGAALLTIAGVRAQTKEIAAAAGRASTTILTGVLASLYVFLGATALGLAGILGVLGGLLALALTAVGRRAPRPLALTLLPIAAVPFALLTWWSVVTPVIAVLLLACGPRAITRAARDLDSQGAVSRVRDH